MKDKITKELEKGKAIIDLYIKWGYPTEGVTYKCFIYDALQLEIDNPNLNWVFDFYLSNEGNNLDRRSSGSIFTALGDIDNFASGLDIDNQSDEIIEFFYSEFKRIFQIKRLWQSF
jgi:hypothetical protein